jgi:uncharacterized protein
MGYSKFRLKESGRIIYYDVDNNALLNEQGETLSLPPEKPLEFYEECKPTHGTRKKHNKPVALRILFGHACNYGCGYCMQKDIGNPDERSKNKDLDKFIESINTYLDLENLERIELWGGEPFLYWNDIQPVMQHLDKKGRHFYISTNGSPLRMKHVEFFDSLESVVNIGISHDGPGQKELRGEEIFDKPSVAEAIKAIDALYPKVQYSFNCVVSRQNYDLFAINDFFKKVSDDLELKFPSVSFTLGRIYDETNSQNSADHVMVDDYTLDFKNIINKYMDARIDQLKTLGKGKNFPLLEANIFDSKIGATSYALSMQRQIPVTMTSNCGADASDVLSIDVQGNVRLCPHTSEKYVAGTINNLKGVRILQLDLDRKNTHCSDCNVRRLCKSSCPIKFPDEVFLQNCRNEKVYYGAVQNTAFKLLFGEDAELLELGAEIDYAVKDQPA